MNAGLVSRAQTWSLADQALVSGINFASGVILARVLGLEAFGAYVVAQMYLLYANTFQASLVVSPMMIAIPASSTSTGDQRRLLNGYLGYTAVVCAATVIAVQLLAGVLGRWWSALAAGDLALPLAALIVAFQAQDWLRRAHYVRSAHRRVFFADVFAYGGYLGVLLVLAASERLDAATAFWAMTFTFGSTAIVELAFDRHWPDPRGAIAVIRSEWQRSRDYLLSWQLQWLASQGVILFGTAIAGQQAAGAIRAAQNLLGPVMVLFQWLDNVLPVRFARHLKEAGAGALRMHAARHRKLGLGALLLFVGALAAVSESLMVAVYGEPYRPFAVLVDALGLYFLFGYAYRIDSYQARVLGQTMLLARASAIWAAMSVVVSAALAFGGKLSALGIVGAMISGEAVAVVYLRLPGNRTLPRAHQGEEGEPTFIVLRSLRGRSRLVLPADSGRHLRATLQMYAVSRWTGHAYQFALGLLLPIAAKTGLARRRSATQAGIPVLSPILGTLPNASPRHIGGLISEESPGVEKLTLRVTDPRGNPLAYARIGRHPAVLSRLLAESHVLQALASTSVRDQVPAILADGVLPPDDTYFLLESAGPDRSAGQVLGEAHFRFLAALRTNASVPLEDVTTRLGRDLIPLLRDGTSANALARRALTRLNINRGVRLATFIEHGDFAPWNVKRSADGRIFVIDWEHAQAEGLPWCDALHFCFQTSVLARRWPAREVLAAMRATMRSLGAAAYADAIGSGLKALDAEDFIVLYLLRAMARDATDGHPTGSLIDRTRIDVLALLAAGEHDAQRSNTSLANVERGASAESETAITGRTAAVRWKGR